MIKTEFEFFETTVKIGKKSLLFKIGGGGANVDYP
jgi:hypothetical protein